MGRRASASLLAAALLALPADGSYLCPPGERVMAFFAGQVDLGGGTVEACKPELEQCFFPGSVDSGPNQEGIFVINWDDGDETVRHVHHTKVQRTSTGEACDGPPEQLFPEQGGEEDWVPPEIACTVMPRLHWEGSEEEWNRKAVAALKKELKPDEVIDGFDWHVILRFNSADRCEEAYEALQSVLKLCKEKNPEDCRTHKYVKAVEYVGDDPETRRKSGRSHHRPEASAKEEL